MRPSQQGSCPARAGRNTVLNGNIRAAFWGVKKKLGEHLLPGQARPGEKSVKPIELRRDDLACYSRIMNMSALTCPSSMKAIRCTM